MRIKNQEDRDREFIKKTIESHVKFLIERRDSLKSAFVHCLDSKAVLELLPDDNLVQKAYEEWKDCFQSADREYFSARTDFYNVLQKLAGEYPDIYIDQDSYRYEWLSAYQYLEKWYKEYRMGKI